MAATHRILKTLTHDGRVFAPGFLSDAAHDFDSRSDAAKAFDNFCTTNDIAHGPIEFPIPSDVVAALIAGGFLETL